jgi:predicted DNA binding CopG/RHH family protein
MKKPHNLVLGDEKKFNNFQELHDFAEEFHYEDNEFEFVKTAPLVMVKIN